jgi:hypothetical protein
MLACVRGSLPLAWRLTRYVRGRVTKKPIPPTQMRKTNTPAQAGAVENRNFPQVSAGAPVITHTAGKSPAASCDAEIRTRSGALAGGVQAKQLVQASIEARP